MDDSEQHGLESALGLAPHVVVVEKQLSCSTTLWTARAASRGRSRVEITSLIVGVPVTSEAEYADVFPSVGKYHGSHCPFGRDVAEEQVVVDVVHDDHGVGGEV